MLCYMLYAFYVSTICSSEFVPGYPQNSTEYNIHSYTIVHDYIDSVIQNAPGYPRPAPDRLRRALPEAGQRRREGGSERDKS